MGATPIFWKFGIRVNVKMFKILQILDSRSSTKVEKINAIHEQHGD